MTNTIATPVPLDGNKVTLSLEISDTLCKYLLTTAYEGGSNYWCGCMRTERDAEHNVTRIISCVDREDPDTFFGDADLNTVRLGVARIVNGTVKVRDDIRMSLVRALVDPDSCQWDAEGADCALQAGLLGEITYG